jgi:hypothetical protein
MLGEAAYTAGAANTRERATLWRLISIGGLRVRRREFVD